QTLPFLRQPPGPPPPPPPSQLMRREQSRQAAALRSRLQQWPSWRLRNDDAPNDQAPPLGETLLAPFFRPPSPAKAVLGLTENAAVPDVGNAKGSCGGGGISGGTEKERVFGGGIADREAPCEIFSKVFRKEDRHQGKGMEFLFSSSKILLAVEYPPAATGAGGDGAPRGRAAGAAGMTAAAPAAGATAVAAGTANTAVAAAATTMEATAATQTVQTFPGSCNAGAAAAVGLDGSSVGVAPYDGTMQAPPPVMPLGRSDTVEAINTAASPREARTAVDMAAAIAVHVPTTAALFPPGLALSGPAADAAAHAAAAAALEAAVRFEADAAVKAPTAEPAAPPAKTSGTAATAIPVGSSSPVAAAVATGAVATAPAAASAQQRLQKPPSSAIIVSSCPDFERHFGFASREVVGMTLAEVLAGPGTNRKTLWDLAVVMSTGVGSASCYVNLYNREGEPVSCYVSLCKLSVSPIHGTPSVGSTPAPPTAAAARAAASAGHAAAGTNLTTNPAGAAAAAAAVCSAVAPVPSACQAAVPHHLLLAAGKGPMPRAPAVPAAANGLTAAAVAVVSAAADAGTAVGRSACGPLAAPDGASVAADAAGAAATAAAAKAAVAVPEISVADQPAGERNSHGKTSCNNACAIEEKLPALLNCQPAAAASAVSSFVSSGGSASSRFPSDRGGSGRGGSSGGGDSSGNSAASGGTAPPGAGGTCLYMAMIVHASTLGYITMPGLLQDFFSNVHSDSEDDGGGGGGGGPEDSSSHDGSSSSGSSEDG
ncbi:unnamed protein product, partial [Phaeothamnion confervicola]